MQTSSPSAAISRDPANQPALPQAKPVDDVQFPSLLGRIKQQTQHTVGTPGRSKRPGPGTQAVPTTSLTSLSTKVSQLEVSAKKPVACKELAPFSGSTVKLPRRPDYGTAGKTITLVSNYFQMTLPEGHLFHYDVEISRVGKSSGDTKKVSGSTKYRCLHTKTNRAVIQRLVKGKGGIFDGASPAFDGRKNMYFRTRLPNDSYDVNITLEQEKESADFHVAIQFVGSLSMASIQDVYKDQGREKALAIMQAIHCVLKHGAAMTYTPVGRSFFQRPNPGHVPELGGGKEVWFGFTPTVHFCQWKPMLNLNVTATTFYKKGPLVEFICKVFNDEHFMERLNNQPMNCKDIKKIDGILRNTQLRATHLPYKPRIRVTGLTMTAAFATKFKDEQGRDTVVAEYFHHRYGPLRYPNLPCIRTGTKEKPRYYPFEICEIPDNFHCRTKLSGQETSQMIRMTATPPGTRFKEIGTNVTALVNDNNSVAPSFGIQIDTKPVELEGRVLSAPQIVYNSSKVVQPRDGQWMLQGSQFLSPATLNSWAVLNFATRLREDILSKFLSKFQDVGESLGMTIAMPGKVHTFRYKDKLEVVLKDMSREFRFVLIILSPQFDYHDQIKLICEKDLGLQTQCCMEKNVFNVATKMMTQPQPALLVNLCHKVNAKCGGEINTISDKPKIFERPVIILGADVNHPAPGRSNVPSFAALVGSLDRRPSKYHASVRIQAPSADSNEREIIRDLKGMTKEALRAFRRETNIPPDTIIFYRDGVSEGQFAQVLHYELSALRQACTELNENYQPAIVFLVVQKRHNTRFMPRDFRDGSGKCGNIPPGTTVDRVVTHPVDFDFFLCSHFGIQGTSRPTHYYVLHDDVGFKADDLQKLTYYLCHTYARCPRSVSIPAPAYYAHWVAFRANQHAASALGDARSSIGSQEALTDEELSRYTEAVNVKENLRQSMYFV